MIIESNDKAQFNRHRAHVLFDLSEDINEAVKTLIRTRANKPCNLDSTIQGCIDAANAFGLFDLADEISTDFETEKLLNSIN